MHENSHGIKPKIGKNVSLCISFKFLSNGPMFFINFNSGEACIIARNAKHGGTAKSILYSALVFDTYIVQYWVCWIGTTIQLSLNKIVHKVRKKKLSK